MSRPPDRASSGALVIVGGGPAGLTTALALAAARPEIAADIVVLERARYPRDKACAGALGRRGDDLLATLGVRLDVPSVAIHGMRFAASAGTRAVRDGDIGRVVRRLELDAALASEVRRRGIRVVEGTKVKETVRTSTGVEVVSDGARWSARLVVGADGVGSVVRRALGLSAGTVRAQVLEVDTEPARGDPPRDLLAFDTSDTSFPGYFWDFPTVVDGRDLVSRGIYVLKNDEGAAANDLAGRLDARLHAQGLSLAQCTQKRFSERGYVRSERLADDRHLLVGEAAGIDPVTGEGIAQAIEYGVLAGAFLARVLGGAAQLEDWDAVLARSRLGLDLRLRTRLARSFYGRSRAPLEAILVDGDAAVRSGCRHFGGKRHDALTLGRVGWKLARTWLSIRKARAHGASMAR